MSLKHILLGLLEEPKSGYDIKQLFNQIFRHFWSAELSQIYPALSQLERDGLSRSHNEASHKGPARRVYKRTAQGTRSHKAWLRAGPEVGKDRVSYLTQVFFLDAVPAAERLAFLADLRQHFVDELEELREVDRYWAAEDPRYPDQLPDDALYKQFTLRLGLKKIAATVDWCDECIAVIKASSK